MGGLTPEKTENEKKVGVGCSINVKRLGRVRDRSSTGPEGLKIQDNAKRRVCEGRERHEIHGGLSSNEIPFFVKAPDLFIYSRVGWLSGPKSDNEKAEIVQSLGFLPEDGSCVFVLGAATDDAFAQVQGRSWDWAVAVNLVRGDETETLVVLASVAVARFNGTL